MTDDDKFRRRSVLISMSALHSLNFIVRHPLNRGEPLRALWRIAAWQVAARLGGCPLAVPFVDGTRLLVARGMSGATGNVYCGLHEFEDMAFVLHALRPGELFVDVGANVGAYTVLAAGAVGAQVVAFEPSPRAHAALLDNLRLNNLCAMVEARLEGVGAEHGSLAFTSDFDTGNHVVAEGEARAASVRVPMVTLDEALAGREPCVIKIDVEGYETAIVAGAGRTLRSARLQGVLLELNGSSSRYGFDETALHQQMLALGLEPARYEPLTRELELCRGVAVGRGNVLYVRDAAALRQRLRAAPRRPVHGTEI